MHKTNLPPRMFALLSMLLFLTMQYKFLSFKPCNSSSYAAVKSSQFSRTSPGERYSVRYFWGISWLVDEWSVSCSGYWERIQSKVSLSQLAGRTWSMLYCLSEHPILTHATLSKVFTTWYDLFHALPFAIASRFPKTYTWSLGDTWHLVAGGNLAQAAFFILCSATTLAILMRATFMDSILSWWLSNDEEYGGNLGSVA